MIEITSFDQYRKNTLQGFLSVRLAETGLEIRDIALHQENGNRWLQLSANKISVLFPWLTPKEVE